MSVCPGPECIIVGSPRRQSFPLVYFLAPIQMWPLVCDAREIYLRPLCRCALCLEASHPRSNGDTCSTDERSYGYDEKQSTISKIQWVIVGIAEN